MTREEAHIDGFVKSFVDDEALWDTAKSELAAMVLETRIDSLRYALTKAAYITRDKMDTLQAELSKLKEEQS